eukprot:351327-Chlamydomonas_euryale.AAC.5
MHARTHARMHTHRHTDTDTYTYTPVCPRPTSTAPPALSSPSRAPRCWRAAQAAGSQTQGGRPQRSSPGAERPFRPS